MKKVIAFLIFLIIIFIVNVWFYYLSDDYRNFLKELKEWKIGISLNEQSFNTDSITDNTNINEALDTEIVEVDNKKEDIYTLKIKDTNETKNDVTLWKNYQEILKLFSIYNLIKLEINSNLFEITDEYPDKYYEYYSKDLSLYLFPTKTYSEVYDIFSVLSSELPFTVKEVNNFWEKSFYINLNKDIEDRFIRLVISNKWIVFWLKIKKSEYDLVKQKLNTLKNQ